jgi:hypothetical protein
VRLALVGVVVVPLALAGCSRSERDDAAARAPAADTTAAAAPASGPAGPALEEGNAAYRARRWDVALARYRAAAQASPRSAAPYFGILMAARKLGNAPLADSARAAILSRVDTAAGRRDTAGRARGPARLQ